MSRSCVTQYSSSSDFYLLIQKYNPIIRVSAAQGHGLQASLGVPGRQGRGDTLPYRRLRASEPTGRGGLSEREGRTTVSKHAPEFQASDACPSLALSRALGKETSSPGMEPGWGKHARPPPCRQREDQLLQSEGQGRGPRQPTGSRLITDLCGQGHCPWCCHSWRRYRGRPAPRAQAPAPASRPPPQPQHTAHLPGQAPAAPSSPRGLRGGPCPRPRSQQTPHSEVSAPCSPRWKGKQSCFPNWHFPVDGTFCAFFHLYHLISKCFPF